MEPSKGESASEGKTISCCDVYKTLWKCRDFELQHCWQRSIFLTAFLIACYAGYGQIILTTIAENKELSLAGSPIVNGWAFLLSLVGIVLSVFWIQMGKASKAWYECYEKAIVAFADQKKYFENGVDEIAGFKYRDIPGYEPDRISNWLWTTAGGGYSPSKINIAIGHLSLLIWLGASILHLMIACDTRLNGRASQMLKDWIVEPAHMGLLFVLAILGLWLYSLVCLKSRWLNETDSQKSGRFKK